MKGPDQMAISGTARYLHGDPLPRIAPVLRNNPPKSKKLEELNRAFPRTSNLPKIRNLDPGGPPLLHFVVIERCQLRYIVPEERQYSSGWGNRPTPPQLINAGVSEKVRTGSGVWSPPILPRARFVLIKLQTPSNRNPSYLWTNH